MRAVVIMYSERILFGRKDRFAIKLRGNYRYRVSELFVLSAFIEAYAICSKQTSVLVLGYYLISQ